MSKIKSTKVESIVHTTKALNNVIKGKTAVTLTPTEIRMVRSLIVSVRRSIRIGIDEDIIATNLSGIKVLEVDGYPENSVFASSKKPRKKHLAIALPGTHCPTCGKAY